MSRSFCRPWAVSLLGLLAAGPALAGEQSAAAPPVADYRPEYGYFSVQEENDKFTGSDRHYTQGIRFSWLSPEGAIPEFGHDVAQAIPLFPAASIKRWGVSVGHSIFTPSNTQTPLPQPDDRPYAGWLYGSVGFVSDTGSRLDSVELTLGMVGEAAQGEFVQNNFHELIGVDTAKGWDNQLDDEFGVMLTYERKWKAWQAYDLGWVQADLTPSVGVALGNVMTYAAAGAMLRLGMDLPNDYGPPRIRPSLPGTTFFVPQDTGLGWYVFAGVEGRAVAHNVFLDGNTFRDDGPSVSRRTFVGDLQAGIAVTIDDIRIAYTHVFRTREFDEQDRGDQFGSLSVTVRF